MHRHVLTHLTSQDTVATDQIICYPETSGWTKYTFSIWAFPEETYISTLRAYVDFARRHFAETGFRCDMLNVGYRIAHDRSSLFSYTWDGPVLTVDPVSTGGSGWDDFLRAYNEFSSAHGGSPLFNQTKWLEPRPRPSRLRRPGRPLRAPAPGDGPRRPHAQRLLPCAARVRGGG